MQTVLKGICKNPIPSNKNLYKREVIKMENNYKLKPSQIDFDNADIDFSGGLIPLHNKELQHEIGLGKLFIQVHFNQNDINKSEIFLTTCQIEIIGSWLWVSGNTFQYKDIFKELHFTWCKNKSAWSYHTDSYKKKSSKTYSMDTIREMFGSQPVASVMQSQLA